MALLRIFTIFALIGSMTFARTLTDADEYKADLDDIIEDMIIYTSEHDIVKLFVPLNALNYDKNHNLYKHFKKPILFFVEADIDPSGKRIDQGLYVFKDGKATKLLEHGRDVDASGDSSSLVFFGAQDGLYVYNQNTNSAEKYGPITDSIIQVAKERQGDVIYILTENHELYKVSNNGATKEKVEGVTNAEQITVDDSNNIYFYTDDKKVFFRTADGVKKIEGLPELINNITFFKLPFLTKNVAFSIVDDTAYAMFANGTSYHQKNRVKSVDMDDAPVAFVLGEPSYLAYDKMILEGSFTEFKLLDVAQQFDDLLSELIDHLAVMKRYRNAAMHDRLHF